MASALLAFHVAAGVGALVLGPLTLLAAVPPGRLVRHRRDRHDRSDRQGWLDRHSGLDPQGRPGAAGWQGRSLLAYQAAVLAVCASSLGLVAFAWSQLWWLTFFAVGTAVAMLGGSWAARRRRPAWAGWSVRLTCGSYVAMVTALLVVSWPTLLSWLLPTLVGALLVEIAAARTVRRTAATVASTTHQTATRIQ